MLSHETASTPEEEQGDDLCDLCMSSGVHVDRTTYCGKTIGNECGCNETSNGKCGDPDCPDCKAEGSESYFTNYYMHCGVQWEDSWSCMCNDECPKCRAEIEPYKSEDADGDLVYHVSADWVPEGGWPEGCESRED